MAPKIHFIFGTTTTTTINIIMLHSTTTPRPPLIFLTSSLAEIQQCDPAWVSVTPEQRLSVMAQWWRSGVAGQEQKIRTVLSGCRAVTPVTRVYTGYPELIRATIANTLSE